MTSQINDIPSAARLSLNGNLLYGLLPLSVSLATISSACLFISSRGTFFFCSATRSFVFSAISSNIISYLSMQPSIIVCDEAYLLICQSYKCIKRLSSLATVDHVLCHLYSVCYGVCLACNVDTSCCVQYNCISLGSSNLT